MCPCASRPDTQAQPSQGCHEIQTSLPGNPSHRERQPARVLSHGNTRRRRRRVLSDYAVHGGRRALSAGVRRGQAQRLRPQHHRRRSGRRARRPGRRDRALGVRQARGQLHIRPGRRLRRRAVLPRSGQVLHDGAGGCGARADQARPERPLRARRCVRRARHGMDHRVRQGRAAGRRPVAHSSPGDRAQSDARHERAWTASSPLTSSGRSTSTSRS